MKMRFTSKVLLVTALPVVTTAIILATILMSGRINAFNENINNQGNNIVSYLSPISEYGIFSSNFTYLNSTIDHTLSQPDIVAIYITDANKNILLKRLKSGWDEYNINNNDDMLYKTFSANITRTSIEINDVETESNVTTNNSPVIGTINIVFSLVNSKIAKSRIIKNGVFITLISTILTILVALLFSRSVTKPITTIHAALDTIRKGNLHHRIGIDFSGELADLAQDINKMTASLEIAHIKDKQRAEDELFIEKTKAQITLEAIGEGVITTDIKGNVTYINPTAVHLTGYTLEQSLNKPLSYIFKIRREGEEQLSDYPITECINKSVKIHHESGYILYRDDGAQFTIRETATPLLDKEGQVIGAVLVFHDFTNIKKMSDVLAYQATHDDLTGLLNRRAFETRLHDILKNMGQDDLHILCYIDLDQFKIINDTCGHLAGDNLLKLISSKINDNIRRNDLFARLGGDEFGVIFFDCDIEKAQVLAENIKNIISSIKFTWDTHTFKVGSSIGIVPIKHNENMTDLMMTVDTACYVAKDKGRNRIHIYEHDDKDVMQREGELQWFQKIHQAIDEDQFTLYSQKIALHSDEKYHEIHEILIRLNDYNEIIFPNLFIPAAERYALMPKVDMWVIQTLLKKLKKYNTNDDYHFSVNLSGQTLTDESFISFLSNELDKTHFPTEKLVFEITETAAISNFENANNFITEFKKRGCKFALDDFGSGMSSFQYLSELEIDFIKIDGSFIKNIADNPFNQSVVKSISQIGHSLDLKIIAEFVENDAILKQLDKSLIDYVQGYGIERPQPLDDLLG